MARRGGTRRQFGAIRRLPSGRYQASYLGPDSVRYTAPRTFDVEDYASEWLGGQRRAIDRGEWRPPGGEVPLAFGDYAQQWLAQREIEASTRDLYAQLLRNRLLPTFGSMPLRSIRLTHVKAWFADQLVDAAGVERPTARAHAYGLMRTIMNSAVEDEAIDTNPCSIRNGGVRHVTKTHVVASTAQIDAMVAHVAEVQRRPQWSATILIAAWCAMRFGEVVELRRRDVDLDAGVIRVERAAARSKTAGTYVKAPKGKVTAATRTVQMPPHIVDAVRAHLNDHVGAGMDALLFTGVDKERLDHHTLNPHFKRAAADAGLPSMTFHDLRHTGATLFAHTGATTKEIQARLGHTDPRTAARYQHVAQGREQMLADRMSAMVRDPQS